MTDRDPLDSELDALLGDGWDEDRRGDAWEQPPRQNGQDNGKPHTEEHAQTEEPFRFNFVPAAEFFARSPEIDYYIDDVLAVGQPCVIGGGFKTLKSLTALDLAISLSTGTSFLGKFPVRKRARCGVMSGESGEPVLIESGHRIAESKGIKATECGVFMETRLPALSDPMHLAALDEAIREHELEVCTLDPLYLSMLSGATAEGLSAANLYQTGPLLLAAARICLAAGATPILVHHFKTVRADPYGEPQLEDLAYSGIKEFARQWILLGRRSAFDPEDRAGKSEIWLATGGSAGHSMLRAVDVCEGKFRRGQSKRGWKVEVFSPTDARTADEDTRATQKGRKKEAKDKKDDAALLTALDELDPDREGVSFTRIRTLADVPNERAHRAFWRLAQEGIIEEFTAEVSGGNGSKQTATFYRRKPGPDER